MSLAIFVSQVVAKSQIHKIFKSQNLTDILRFKPIFSLMWSQLKFLKAYTKFQDQKFQGYYQGPEPRG